MENTKGKASESRVSFADAENRVIQLHKPHPKNILKQYQLDLIVDKLKDRGDFK